MSHILTTKEVAAQLGTTPASARRLLRMRRLRGTKLGGRWRVRSADLEEMLTEDLVDQGLVEEAEYRRATSKGTLTLAELKERLGL